MFGYKYNNEISDSYIEEKARGLGMHFKDECKSFIERKDN